MPIGQQVALDYVVTPIRTEHPTRIGTGVIYPNRRKWVEGYGAAQREGRTWYEKTILYGSGGNDQGFGHGDDDYTGDGG
jgi:hypothetical protein